MDFSSDMHHEEPTPVCVAQRPPWLEDLLVFVPVGLCREVVSACMTFGRRNDGDIVMPRYFPECVLKQWHQRRQRLLDARMQYAIAFAHQLWWDDSSVLQQERQQQMWAQLQLWPSTLPASLDRLGYTIIREIRMVTRMHLAVSALEHQRPHLLDHFQHTRSKMHSPMRERWRARMLGVASEQYRASWAACYQWVYERLLDQLHQGWNLMRAVARIGISSSSQPFFNRPSCFIRSHPCAR